LSPKQADPANPSQFVTLAMLSYDSAGRLHTETDANGYMLTYSYAGEKQETGQ